MVLILLVIIVFVMYWVILMGMVSILMCILYFCIFFWKLLEWKMGILLSVVFISDGFILKVVIIFKLKWLSLELCNKVFFRFFILNRKVLCIFVKLRKFFRMVISVFILYFICVWLEILIYDKFFVICEVLMFIFLEIWVEEM